MDSVAATYKIGRAVVRIHPVRTEEERRKALEEANVYLFRAAEKQIPGYFKHLRDVNGK